MGYVKHHAIVVTSWAEGHIDAAHAEATKIGLRVTPITEAGINGYRSFLIAPDGSKEGWGDSDLGDDRRAAFVEWARAYDGYLDWAEIAYGPDDETATVTRHAWHPESAADPA